MIGQMLAGLCSALRTDYKTVLESWQSGEFSEATIYGLLQYDSTQGKSYGMEMYTRSGSGISVAPKVQRTQLGKNLVRETTTAGGNPTQLAAAGGLNIDKQVNIKELLAQGLPLGIPEDVLRDYKAL